VSCTLEQVGLAKSPTCSCGQQHTMNHIVDTGPLTNFEGRLQPCHEPEEDAVRWLEFIAATALAK